ncbi:cupin domain-containing protein [Pseudomonas sp. 10S4]|uniref:cupin domain-containing protein n=1 Tax=Pseudomonas sp. 10S4 TaxID=3048583 RepID=UPI002AC9EDE3|nr:MULTISPECIES: cupin domain-containing protein [unclassified Pseudomonas]MEB0225176.1 cupin domain-containing protein [Pseudomonas sp. 5S1]MEB0293972.1 cupin domain-containing protein [Pseudomonas sp. 10S4]WPX17029.1 cupin domain-containing protein [Pseudomonas sp. 10S4]
MSQPTVLLLARADGSRVATPFKTLPLNAADPFMDTRQIAWSGADGVSAGIVDAGEVVDIEDFPHTEVIVVHAGHVKLITQEQTLELGVGASAVIGRGTTLRIEAHAGTQWAFCAMSTETPTPGLTFLDPLAMLSPSAAPEPQILIGPAPQCRSRNAFEDAATDLRVGVWDSTPYERHGRAHKLNELMHLIEGSVTLLAPAGSSVTVSTGDSVFVPQGAPCAWKSTRYVRKVYAVK